MQKFVVVKSKKFLNLQVEITRICVSFAFYVTHKFESPRLRFHWPLYRLLRTQEVENVVDGNCISIYKFFIFFCCVV